MERKKKARKRQWGSKSEERKMVGSHGRRVTWGSWAMSLKNTVQIRARGGEAQSGGWGDNNLLDAPDLTERSFIVL